MCSPDIIYQFLPTTATRNLQEKESRTCILAFWVLKGQHKVARGNSNGCLIPKSHCLRYIFFMKTSVIGSSSGADFFHLECTAKTSKTPAW